MEKDILNELENLSQNFDFLLDWLEKSKEEKDSKEEKNTWDFISTEMTSYSTYFKSIDDSLKRNNDIINAYINNIPDTIKQNIETPEETNYNLNLIELSQTINKLNDTILSLNKTLEITPSLTIDVDKLKEELNNIQLNINTDSFQNLKNEINDQNIKININQDDVLKSIDELNTLSKNLESMKFTIDASNSFDEISKIKNELVSIQDMKFDNVNFEILSSTNIDEVILKFNELKNIDIDANFNKLIDKINNFNTDSLVNNLNNIKNINFDNLNLDNLKNNIENIEIELKTLNDMKIDFSFDFSIFDNIEAKIKEINEGITTLNVKPIDIKFNQENLLNDVNNIFDNYSLEIEPHINTDLIKEELNFEYDIKLNPILNLDNLEAQINTKLNVDLNYIKETDVNRNNNSELTNMLQENNKLLSDLTKIMIKNSEMNINQNNKTEINNNDSKTIINTGSDKDTPDIVSIMLAQNGLIEKQTNAIERLIRKTNKPNFNSNNDIL